MAEYIERTEELMLAMNAGARAIENTKHYHGVVYTKDLFSENPKEIPYLQAAKVLREVSDAPVADVAPVAHSYWEHKITNDGENIGICHNCKYPVSWFWEQAQYCPNCGAKMDGGVDYEAD